MTDGPVDFPALSSEHLSNARLFAERNALIAALPVPKGGVIAEVGVARGDFSQVMIERLQPRKFIAFDYFAMHEAPVLFGIPSSVYFDGLPQLEFYRRRFASYGDRVAVEEGLSHLSLAKYPPDSFDLIYIDAGHDYENVKRDATLSAGILKADGILVFNDYTMFDPIHNSRYGVVPAVNELVVYQGWRVIGFALQKHLFCDIALQRPDVGRAETAGC